MASQNRSRTYGTPCIINAMKICPGQNFTLQLFCFEFLGQPDIFLRILGRGWFFFFHCDYKAIKIEKERKNSQRTKQ
jgi:hypothetical protein